MSGLKFNGGAFTLVTILEETAVISAASAIVLAIFAVIQLRHVEKHRNVDVTMKLFEWAENDRLRRAFRWVDNDFEFKNNDDYKTFQLKNIDAAEYPFEVVAFFEQVGFLVEKKFVDFDVVQDRLGQSVISNWQKLETWVLALRKEKSDSSFGEHFQRLYERAVHDLNKQWISRASEATKPQRAST